MSEEFHCRPSEAYAEWLGQPVGLLEEILESRAYEQAKAMTEAADTAEAAKRLPKTPLFRLVHVIDGELVDEGRNE